MEPEELSAKQAELYRKIKGINVDAMDRPLKGTSEVTSALEIDPFKDTSKGRELSTPATLTTPKSSIASSLAVTESGGDTTAFRTNKDGESYGGRLQFGQARLDDFNKEYGTKLTPQDYAKQDSKLQDQVESWHFKDIDNFIDQQGLDAFIGKEINGTVVTRSGIQAMAHLGGKQGAKDFLLTNGADNPADELGTRLGDYLETHKDGSQNAFDNYNPDSLVDGNLTKKQQDLYESIKAGPKLQSTYNSNIDVTDYASYIGGVDTRRKDLDYLRASNQGFGEQLWRTVKTMPADIVLSLTENVGTIFDVEAMYNGLFGKGDDFSNWLTEFANKGKDWINDGNELYLLDPQERGMDWSDSAAWLTHGSQLVESIVAFGAIGFGIGGALFKGAEALSTALSLGLNGVRAAQGLAQVGTSYFLTYSEGAMEAAQVYKTRKEQALNRGFSEEQANVYASEGAAYTVKSNMVNMALNMTALTPILRSPSSLRAMEKSILARIKNEPNYLARLKELAPQSKALSRLAVQVAKEGPQESLEEIINEIASSEGLSYGENGNTTFKERLSEILKKPETSLAAGLGFIGGAGQTVLTSLTPTKQKRKNEKGDVVEYWQSNFSREAAEEAELFEKTQKDLISRLEEFEQASNDLKTHSDSGDISKYRQAQDRLFKLSAVDAITRGIEQQMIDSYEEIANLDEKEAIERGFNADSKSPDYYVKLANDQINSINELTDTWKEYERKYGFNSDEEIAQLPLYIFTLEVEKRNLEKELDRLSKFNDVANLVINNAINEIDAKLTILRSEYRDILNEGKKELLKENPDLDFLDKVQTESDKIKLAILKLNEDWDLAEKTGLSNNKAAKDLQTRLVETNKSLRKITSSKGRKEFRENFRNDVDARIKKNIEALVDEVKNADSDSELQDLKDKASEDEKNNPEVKKAIADKKAEVNNNDAIESEEQAVDKSLPSSAIEEDLEPEGFFGSEKTPVETSKEESIDDLSAGVTLGKKKKSKPQPKKSKLPNKISDESDAPTPTAEELQDEVDNGTLQEEDLENSRLSTPRGEDIDDKFEMSPEERDIFLTDIEKTTTLKRALEAKEWLTERYNLDSSFKAILDKKISDLTRRNPQSEVAESINESKVEEEQVKNAFDSKKGLSSKIDNAPLNKKGEEEDENQVVLTKGKKVIEGASALAHKAQEFTTKTIRDGQNEFEVKVTTKLDLDLENVRYSHSSRYLQVGDEVILEVDKSYSNNGENYQQIIDGASSEYSEALVAPISVSIIEDGKKVIVGYIHDTRWIDKANKSGYPVNVADTKDNWDHQKESIRRVREYIFANKKVNTTIVSRSNGTISRNYAFDSANQPIVDKNGNQQKEFDKVGTLIPDSNVDFYVVKGGQFNTSLNKPFAGELVNNKDKDLVDRSVGIIVPFGNSHIALPVWVPNLSQQQVNTIYSLIENFFYESPLNKKIEEELGTSFDILKDPSSLSKVLENYVFLRNFDHTVFSNSKITADTIHFTVSDRNGHVRIARQGDSVIYTTNPDDLKLNKKGSKKYLDLFKHKDNVLKLLEQVELNVLLKTLNSNRKFKDIVINGEEVYSNEIGYKDFLRANLETDIYGRNSIFHKDGTEEFIYAVQPVIVMDTSFANEVKETPKVNDPEEAKVKIPKLERLENDSNDPNISKVNTTLEKLDRLADDLNNPNIYYLRTSIENKDLIIEALSNPSSWLLSLPKIQGPSRSYTLVISRTYNIELTVNHKADKTGLEQTAYIAWQSKDRSTTYNEEFTISGSKLSDIANLIYDKIFELEGKGDSDFLKLNDPVEAKVKISNKNTVYDDLVSGWKDTKDGTRTVHSKSITYDGREYGLEFELDRNKDLSKGISHIVTIDWTTDNQSRDNHTIFTVNSGKFLDVYEAIAERISQIASTDRDISTALDGKWTEIAYGQLSTEVVYRGHKYTVTRLDNKENNRIRIDFVTRDDKNDPIYIESSVSMEDSYNKVIQKIQEIDSNRPTAKELGFISEEDSASDFDSTLDPPSMFDGFSDANLSIIPSEINNETNTKKLDILEDSERVKITCKIKP